MMKYSEVHIIQITYSELKKYIIDVGYIGVKNFLYTNT